jgi:glycosyltransferase involved in cell wall biosynthesis
MPLKMKKSSSEKLRLAIITSHPIQYYAPWFRHIASHTALDLRVFYLWDSGVRETLDRGFGRTIQWDVPLLDGYASEFVPNVSAEPGTHRFSGLRNPTLVQRVDAFHPDAVMMIGYNAQAFVQFVLRRGKTYPLLLRGDSHRLVAAPDSTRQRFKRHLLQQWFRRYAGFLYVGSANREYYSIHGVDDARLFFAPHAVDNARFAAEGTAGSGARFRSSLGIADSARLILFAGKLEEKKRPLDLLAAFHAANLEGSTLLFVGEGPLEGDLRRAAAGDRRIVFAPFQNQSVMPAVYAAADLFVLPSFGPSETWGLAVNEAMAVGRGVVVSSHVGCARDLVIQGENGLVFQAGNVAGLTDSLRAAFSDEKRLTTWGTSSRSMIERYSYEAATAGLLEALEATVVS